MRSLRFLSVFAALIAALALVVACGGTEPEPQMSWTGTDVDTIPDGARDAIECAIETVFTWYPAEDESTRDAYERASKCLTPELAGANNASERGTSVWWEEWKVANASVIADALIVVGEHPKDSDDAVERAVMLNQKVTAPDGAILEQSDMRVDRVAAIKQGDDWRVSVISFFPDMPTQAPSPPECAEGEERLLPPAGPCVPIPQVPPGPGTQPQEPGSSEPGSQPQQPGSPEPGTQPQQPGSPGPGTPNTGNQGTPCSDGTTVPPGQTCPLTPDPPVPCPDGSPRLPDGTCYEPPPPCPDGSPRLPDGTCYEPPPPCPDGSPRLPDGTCYESPDCPGSFPLPDGTCYVPPDCSLGSIPMPDGTCYTPEWEDDSSNRCGPGSPGTHCRRPHQVRARSRSKMSCPRRCVQ